VAGDTAAAQRRQQLENLPYTIKSGDFKLLVAPSFGVDYNDNINAAHSGALDDFILRPYVQFTGSYPITRGNLLRLDIGLGYDAYINHTDYSGFRINSGSDISFDTYAGDFWFNLHDRLSYTEDAAGQPSIANAGQYGGFDNTVGLSTTWDLRDLTLTLGYDHDNFIASTTAYEYTDRASELMNFRAGLRLDPALTTGLEAAGGYTAYDEQILNNNWNYSFGAYADWQRGAIHVQLRGGYTEYLFDQTSLVIQAVNQDAWYLGLTVTHNVTDAISYSIGFGHELKLGIQADTIEDWYLRPSVTWKIIKDLNLTGFLSYEHGTQGQNYQSGGFTSEDYDWLGLGFGVSHPITKKLSASLNYRLTLRDSNLESRGYTQNLVGVQLKYLLQ
jgi:hypothetical protein